MNDRLVCILEVFVNYLEWIIGGGKQKYVLHQALYSGGVANGSTNATVSNRTGDVTGKLPGRESCKYNPVYQSRTVELKLMCSVPVMHVIAIVYEEGCRRYVH